LFPKEKAEDKNISETDNFNDLNDNTDININISNDDDNCKISKKMSYDINDSKQNIDDENDNNFTLNNKITNCKKGEDIRNRYISQLINKGIWIPNIKEKKYNSIIIFDWDDTLLPTSFLNSKGTYNAFRQFTKNERKRLLELENLVLQLLTLSVKKGDVYIITNADKKWIENSSKIFYPSISNILKKIKIISAKNKYQKRYPSRIWKIKAFINLANDIDLQKITNIICSGDSAFEIEAARILATKFTEAFIKTIKFKEKPELDELYKQIKFVLCQFNKIYSAVKNLSITVEKRK
jgi:FMN phosphatase YigB (HAD superfamily)